MSIHVTNEIGSLKKVMLHRPGKELEHLVPGELERLLFDDIPYLKAAQQEHDEFADILKSQGSEVVYLEDLAAEVLRTSPEIRENFIRQIIEEGGSLALKFKSQLSELLNAIEDEKELVLKTMAGISMHELKETGHSPLANLVKHSGRFVMDPIPNLYFTRDPFASIGNGVSLNHMYSKTRRRETIYGELILRHHPDFSEDMLFYYRRENPFCIEGGDILNLSHKILAVGISQRTTPEAIELLAQNIFEDRDSEIEKILALDIPSIRAYMHLDTVLTQIDYDKFTIHPGILDSLKVYEICRGIRKDSLSVIERKGTLAEILCSCMGLDKVTLIRCGGKDWMASEREQWNDGSNTLCINPGKVIVYDRNYITNGILRDNGIEVLEMPSSELSRGRGGPRCMSMPLIRADL
ncbi:arginine deiminase [Novisyntrophococcus fermenticellae]|uniref:arginine deiminase n=1 Tax=Novisyntrophococcus fermenticellae TaxID=2068655 RepID=UPI001E49541B|nr:arginine deiminase [Novisyntrophococcus fermenticellae]